MKFFGLPPPIRMTPVLPFSYFLAFRMMAVESLMALLYPHGHPYGRLGKGTVESVESITRSDLEAFHRETFTPSGLSLVVVGDVPVSRIDEQAHRVFGDWAGDRAAESAVSAPEARPESVVRQADAELSQRLLMRLLERGYLTRSCLAIAANDSAVRLEGTVRRKGDRDAIEQLVTAEPGVSRVTNNLQTGSCPSPSRNPK